MAYDTKYVMFVRHSSDQQTIYYGNYAKLMTLTMAMRELPSDIQKIELCKAENLEPTYKWVSPEWE